MKSFLREFFFLVAVFVAEPIVAINEMILIFCGKLFHLAVDHLQILVGADLEHIGFDIIACHNRVYRVISHHVDFGFRQALFDLF